jgi:hypothetical protein
VNTATREVLAAEPVPVDERGSAGTACVVYEDGAWRTAWLVGTRKTTFGPPFDSARQAAAASRWLNERSQS